MHLFPACRMAVVLLGLALAPGVALAQSGAMEAYKSSNLTLPQTSWIKAEILGNSAIERMARDAVNASLRQHGFMQEKFSPYAVRIEVRGAGVQPVEAAIPQYSNPPTRLSLWNSATAPENVTVSLTLYHQSSGQIYWQAEGTCRNLDPNLIPGEMVMPMMDHFGRNVKTGLSCWRPS